MSVARGDLSGLAMSFQCLRRKPGVAPFDPEKLVAGIDKMSSGEAHAVRFVLGVYSLTAGLGPFNVCAAVGVWDRANLAAFQAWAADPWLA